MIAIRRAGEADASAIADLLVASITALCVADHGNRPDAVRPWLSNKTPEGVRGWLDDPEARLFVAERHGSLAGVGAVRARQVTLNYVSPEHRFVGVSKALLRALESALGPGEATLTSTVTAHRFYRRMGWMDFGEVERYAGMIAHPMCKAL